MKYIILIIAFVFPFSSDGSDFKAKISKNEYGKYSLDYVHNVYNRSEDVVSIIALGFMTENLGMDDIVENKVNKTYSGHYIFHFKGYKNGCIKNADIKARVTIYYKDNRTKLVFDNMVFDNADAKCAISGTVEYLLDVCECDDTFLVGQFLKFTADKLASDYKDFIKKKQKDPSLF